MLRYPGIASVPCSRCVEILGDFIDGEWVPSTRCGVEVKRPAGSNPPCWKCPKLSVEDQRGKNPNPSQAVELTQENWKMWRFYNEIRSGARTPPADPLTIKACGLLYRMERQLEREEAKQFKNK